MKNPLVSVIIPNLNNQDRLDQCLAALQQQSFPAEQTEIIVVDNGSVDRSVEISKKYPVTLLVRNEFRSPYWCRNAGIRAARGTIIALLDSNCIPHSSWLESGMQTLKKQGDAIVTGPIRFQFSQRKTLPERIDYLYSVFNEIDVLNASALPATHLFIPAAIFEHIGYFLPHIRSLGDIEWTGRAYRRGYSFAFAKGAVVDYPAKKAAEAMKKMIRLGGGRKELWVAEGKSVFDPRWIGRVFKNLLPASPAFYRDMAQRNEREQLDVSPLALFLGLWLIKVCRAWGMITKRPLLPPDGSS